MIIEFILWLLMVSGLLFVWSVHIYRKGYDRGWIDSLDCLLDSIKPEQREAYPEIFVDAEEDDDGEP